MPLVFSSVFPLFSEGVVNRTVFGSVLDAAGAAIAGVTVIVSMEGVTGVLTQIGTAVVDTKGNYTLSYDPASFNPQILRVSVTVSNEVRTETVVSPAWNEQVNFRYGLLAQSATTPKFNDVSVRLSGALAPANVTLQALDAAGVARASLFSGVHPSDTVLARNAAFSAQLSSTPAALHFALGEGGMSGAVADVLKHPRADREAALARAVADGALSSADAAAATTALGTLDSLMVTSALEPVTSIANPGHALTLAGVTNSTTRTNVLNAWIAHTGTVDAFWTALNLPQPEKTKLQFALQLDKLTRSNAPLMTQLFGSNTTLSQLVSLDLSAWTSLVGTHAPPSFLTASGITATDYAKAMFMEIEDAYPTPMLAARAPTWFGANGGAIAAFLNGTPAYKLEGDSLRTFVANGGKLTAAGNQAAQDAVMLELPRLERLYRLAPRGTRFEAMRDLRNANVFSSTQIQLMGRARLAAVAPAVAPIADAIFKRATTMTSISLALQTQIGARATYPSFGVVPQWNEGLPSSVSSNAVWQEMFGGRTFCACKDCQSALGPAAYLADLLFWLRTRDVSFTSTLLARRADIGSLQLSCKNTNTPLPSIDLILERLESLIGPTNNTQQTSLEADELAARPEHVNRAAYDRVAGLNDAPALYPFDQPYVWSLDRQRTFMSAVGVERATAMITREDGGLDVALAKPEVAAEVLGLTRTSWNTLTQGGRSAAEHWGLARDLTRPTPSWTTANGAIVTSGEADPFGGNLAFKLEDNSTTLVGEATLAIGTVPGTNPANLVLYSGSLRVRQSAGPHSAEIGIGVGGNYTGRTFFIKPVSGTFVAAGITPTVVTNAAGTWHDVSFSLAVPEGSVLTFRVRPAAASGPPAVTAVTVGVTFIYAPRFGTASALSSVKTFLARAGDRAAEQPLAYAVLEDLIRSQFVQDAGTSRIAIRFNNKTCDIDGASLVVPAAPTDPLDPYLVRMAKLLRLSRALGWSIADTDRALVLFRTSSGSLSESDLSETFLVKLANVVWLARSLGRSPQSLLDWWGPLDTRRWASRVKGLEGATTNDRIFDKDSANAGGPEAEPSPFQRRAQRYKVGEPLALFAVVDSGAELLSTASTVSANLDAVAALVGGETAEVLVLSRALGNDALTLGNVSRLAAMSELAQALGLSASELVEWTMWRGSTSGAPPPAPPVNPFKVFDSPTNTLQFVAEVGRNASARLPSEAVRAVLQADGVPNLPALGLPREGTALLALGDVVRAHRAPDDPARFDIGTLTDGNLLPPPTTLAWSGSALVATGAADPAGGTLAVTLEDAAGGATQQAASPAGVGYGNTAVWGSIWIRKSPGASDPGAEYFARIGIAYGGLEAGSVAVNLVTGKLAAVALLETAIVDAGDWWFVVLRHAGGTGAPSIVVKPAAGATFPTDAAAAVGKVVVFGARIAPALAPAASPLYPYATRDRALVRQVAALLGLDVTLASRLLSTLRDVPLSKSAFDSLLADAAVIADKRDIDATATASPEAVESALVGSGSIPSVWTLIATAGWLCRTFDLQASDIPYLIGPAGLTARGSFDLETIVYGANVSVRYGAWAKLRELARLQTVSSDGRLLDLLATWIATPAPTPTVASNALAQRTGWDAPSVEAWMTTETLPLLGTASRFARMAALFTVARQTRIPFSRLESWGSLRWSASSFAEPDYNAVGQEAEDTARSVWGEERWRADMPAIRERLRERQRSGLVSRLVGDPLFGNFASAPALGEHLLMDVQMGGCDRTSRVRDGIRAVQAFVQRVLLGLEGTLRLTEAESREWVWRKNYRIWEANRKVFLYPENWLRPELRRQKTPFFADLETELAGGDLRPELVEDAYRNYLRKLSDVSRLETLAVYRENRTDGPSVSHVFARTRGIPATYYHREREDDGTWSPWREMAKVEGEHLIPIVYQRRLMVFWLRISDSAKEEASSTVPSTGDAIPAPTRFFLVRLAWSEYRDGKWSTPTQAAPHMGVDERGNASADLVNNFISVGAGRTQSPRVLTGRARIDTVTNDLLIDVYRNNSTSAGSLQSFRVSAVDRNVTVEAGGPPLATPRPSRGNGRFYRGQAQRFELRSDSSYQLALRLPLAHPSTSSAPATEVLERVGGAPNEQLRVVGAQPLAFDATEPFVFEDDRGSYWVTYDPRPFFLNIAFSGSYVPGADRDLRLKSSVRVVANASESIAGPQSTAFRSAMTSGTTKLLSDATLQQTRIQGGKVVAVNGQNTDGTAKRLGITSNYSVKDSNGAPLIAARAGAVWDVDDIVQVGQVYELPPVQASPSLYVNGVHILVSPRELWRFDTFFHPHVGIMRETLNRLGVFALLDPTAPSEPLAGQNPQPATTLESRYTRLATSYTPPDDLDFSTYGAYSQYNWELYFHAPFLIASRLHEAGKFEDAIKWIRTIFDPFRPAQAGQGATEARPSYWRFRPFREEFPNGSTAPRNIQQAIALLTANADAATTAQAREMLRQISDWRKNPFDPHAIAQTRTVTYMTAVVMKYLEIILDWGDELFARDTLEAIGEASELYLLAARILGPRPEEVAASSPAIQTFDQLLTDFQNGVGPSELIEESVQVQAWEVAAADDDEASSLATLLYFCVPANPDLNSKYWGRVSDRLFKIRNCLDIQGRRRELALFEPPIDPDLLVRAAAAGVDLQSAMADIVTGRVPHRRYLAMAELAAGLAAGAQGLGQALLGAVEKRDADQLNTIRSRHERRLQEDAIRARKDQVTEIERQRESLQENRAATVARLTYYTDRPRTNAKEQSQLDKSMLAKGLSDASAAVTGLATVLGLIPEFDVGTNGAFGTPKITAAFGGRELIGVANALSRGLDLGAASLEREGRMLLAESGYDRRKEDWDLQATLAQHDLNALDARILASDIQLAMAQRALESAELRLTQIDEVTDFLERRFAREDLYDWLSSELTRLHYQSYQLAYEFAKKAERAWQYELGKSDSFIQFGYWDSTKRGLLAADSLLHDLRRMQVAYSEISNRRLEVDQTFSMRELDPVALMNLKATGEADLVLPEAFFDVFYPGQYGRRIRAVRLSIPAAVPPNTNLPAHVELLRHWIRKTSTTTPTDLVEGGYGNSPVTMTATSTAQRDAGVFEFDFRGPKLLPFEGAGAVSRWRVKLPSAVRPFDYDQIQDVHFHVAYDAEYNEGLRTNVQAGTRPLLLNNLFAPFGGGPVRRRAISLRAEHGGALRRLIAAAATAPANFTVSIDVKDALPVYLRGYPVTLSNVRLVVTDATITTSPTPPKAFKIKLNTPEFASWSQWSAAGNLMAASPTTGTVFPTGTLDGTHTIQVTDWTGLSNLGPDFDITIVVDLS